MSKLFEKGNEVHSVEVLHISSSKLYFDAAHTREVKQADVKKLGGPSKIVVTDETDLFAVTSVKIDGSAIVVGSDSYSIAE